MKFTNPPRSSLNSQILSEIRLLIDSARQRAAVKVNAELTLLFWQVGKRINQERLGNERASYGDEVVVTLAKQLTAAYGRGWSARHLRLCIRLAQVYVDPAIVHTLYTELSW